MRPSECVEKASWCVHGNTHSILSFQEQWGQFGTLLFVHDDHFKICSSTVFGCQRGEPSIDYPPVN